jgi:lactoylglutathione lyase
MNFPVGAFSHLAVNTTKPEELAAFYSQKLGFKEAFRLNRPDGATWIIYLDLGNGGFLELLAQKPALDAVERPKLGFVHLCLAVENLQRTLEQLQNNGLEADAPGIRRGADGNLQAWIKDPDGNRIELMELLEDGLQKKYQRTAEKI